MDKTTRWAGDRANCLEEKGGIQPRDDTGEDAGYLHKGGPTIYPAEEKGGNED